MSPANCSACVESRIGAFPILGNAIAEMIAMTTITMTTSVSVNPADLPCISRCAGMVSRCLGPLKKKGGRLAGHPPCSRSGIERIRAGQQPVVVATEIAGGTFDWVVAVYVNEQFATVGAFLTRNTNGGPAAVSYVDTSIRTAAPIPALSAVG